MNKIKKDVKIAFFLFAKLLFFLTRNEIKVRGRIPTEAILSKAYGNKALYWNDKSSTEK